MTTPRNWIPGEPITAERLNVGQQESLRARRQIALGDGSSMVNEIMGNQAANLRKRLIRLAIAIEDFIPAGERTDLAEGVDDVPSGLCKWYRLDRKSGNHVEDTLSAPFLCYDVIGGLNNGVLRVRNEIFYVIHNEDSKRFEILQSVSFRLTYGIARTCLGDGWYEVEISDWNETPNTTSESASLSASVSSSASDDPCDLCVIQPTEELLGDTEACDTIQEVEVSRNVGFGTGQIVYGHTAETVPLLIGGMVKMLKRGNADSQSMSASASSSSSISESASLSVSDDILIDRLYDIVDSTKPLLSLPFPHYECCTLPDGSKEVRMTRCDRAIVEGVKCPGSENPCPTSDSLSASV